jgi:methyltransferase (TIGR00027 family)
MPSNKLFLIQRALEMLGGTVLPDLSNSLGVAKLRYIQSVYEPPESRNPDTLIRELLPSPIRWLSILQGALQLSKLRLSPFYYYLIARTRYYDKVFTDALTDTRCIINVGCGTDTRAYRLASGLNGKAVKVLECDQPQSIGVKQQLATKKWRTDHVNYLAIDLNDGDWPELDSRLAQIPAPILVMLEGVSAYIDEKAFTNFLAFLAVTLQPGSRIVYDYKIRTVDGPAGPRRGQFRLSAAKEDIVAYHEALGYELKHMELSSDLSSRLLPNVPNGAGLFTEDCLLELVVRP